MLWKIDEFTVLTLTFTDIDASGEEVEGSGRGTGGRIVSSGAGGGGAGEDDEDTVYSGSGSGMDMDVKPTRKPSYPHTRKPFSPHKTPRPIGGSFDDQNPRYTVSTKKPESGAGSVTSGVLVIMSVLFTACRHML